MEERFTEEDYLLQLLSESLKKRDEHTDTILDSEKLDWNKFLTVAENHAVLPLLYDRLMEETLSFESYSSSKLGSMTTMAGSMAACRQTWC